MSHKRKPSYFPLYWLVNRDPYNALITIYLGSCSSPIYPKQLGLFSLLTWKVEHMPQKEDLIQGNKPHPHVVGSNFGGVVPAMEKLPSLKLRVRAPKNRPKPKRTFHLSTIHFQGLLLLVSGNVTTLTFTFTWRIIPGLVSG